MASTNDEVIEEKYLAKTVRCPVCGGAVRFEYDARGCRPEGRGWHAVPVCQKFLDTSLEDFIDLCLPLPN